MSHQPYSRADRNRIARAIRADGNSVIVTAVNVGEGTVTVASTAYVLAPRCRAGRMLAKPDAPAFGPEPVEFADGDDRRQFTRGRSYERLPDGSWLVTEGE